MIDFKKDDTVVYIPNHKLENYTSEDYEPGIVSSVNNTYIFVKFYAKDENGEHTILKETAQACYPRNIFLRK